MNLPKQSTPVSRDAIPGKNLNQRGVTASILRTEFNRFFNRPGTCTCVLDQLPFGTSIYSPADTRNCNSGFAPQCHETGGCTCIDSRNRRGGGSALIRT
jgi:hypothetical protein